MSFFNNSTEKVQKKLLTYPTKKKSILPFKNINVAFKNKYFLFNFYYNLLVVRIRTSGFRGEDLKKSPIRNKNCLWRPCLVMDHNKMCTLQRGPSIDASYQVSVHLAEGFQRRQRTPSDGKSSYCLWQGWLKRILKCEYLFVMYRINMLHYISIS